jgi:predicted CXXCH cytochrome family protein
MPYAPNGENPVSCFGDGTTTGCHSNAHGSENEKLLSAGAGVTIDQFCYGCHTDGMIVNEAISGASLADDIEEAFSFAAENKHDLGTSFTIGGQAYTLQCTTCHNPHVVTGQYWEAHLGKSPVTRPDFSDPTTNARAVGTTLWGDEPGEKLDDYAGSGTYRTPNGDLFTGAELPDYNTFCEDCHEGMPDPSAEAGAHGQIQFSADPHGRNSANVPNGGGACPNWYGCGKGAGWDGDDCVGTEDACWPVLPRGRGEQIFSRAPYAQEERIAGANFVLSCTDCHEAHGAAVRSLIRSNPNNGTGTLIWNTMCNNCHYYYSDWHAGMSCGSASCHVSGRMGATGTDTLHLAGSRYGSSGTRSFDGERVVDLRFENNLKDSGSWRLHSVWSLGRPNPSGYEWCADDAAKVGTFVPGRVGTAIEIDDQPIEVGTENCYWSTDEGRHGTWKYTEMKYHMTVEGWVSPTVDDGERKILAKHTYWNGGYALVLTQIGGRLRVGLLTNMTGGSGDCSGLRGAYSSVSIPLGQWTHVAATYDESGPDRDTSDGAVGRIRIYVDGEDVTASYSQASQCFAQPGAGETAMFPHSHHSPDNEAVCYAGHWCASALSIGGLNWSAPADNFVGRLDEVKVWNVTQPASYFSAVDAMVAPRIDRIEGELGSNALVVTFAEGVWGSGAGGELVPADLTLTTYDGAAVVSVLHTPGAATATLILDRALTADDMANGVSVAAANAVDEYANPAPADPVAVTWASCLAGTTTFQLNEPAGSTTVTDAAAFYTGAVNDPADTLAGDGYVYGDGVDNYVDFESHDGCLQASRALTLETRIRPAGIGVENYIKRILARDTGGNYQLSVWRNVNWATYNPPSGVASIALWVRPVDSHGGTAWKPVLTDYDICPIVSDHWYRVTVVWNSDKVGGIPPDIFVDDQGTLGDDGDESWAGYLNCTDADQSQLSADRYLYEGDEITTSDGDFVIGANVNNHGNNVFTGWIDWIVWRDVADYSGVDDLPIPPQG